MCDTVGAFAGKVAGLCGQGHLEATKQVYGLFIFSH